LKKNRNYSARDLTLNPGT